MRIIFIIALLASLPVSFAQITDSTHFSPSFYLPKLNIPDASVYKTVQDSVFTRYTQFEKTDTFIKKGKIRKIVVWNSDLGCITRYRNRKNSFRVQKHTCKLKWALNAPLVPEMRLNFPIEMH